MTPAATARTTRPRDANASREALLASARILFSERGFEQTTVRDIGDHSGVDPALIARYYGSKVKLYLATVTAEDADSGRPKDFSIRGRTCNGSSPGSMRAVPVPSCKRFCALTPRLKSVRQPASISRAAWWSRSRSHWKQRGSPSRGSAPRWRSRR